MQIGDLVKIQQGLRSGTLAVIYALDQHPLGIVHVLRDDGMMWGYYRRDLEVLNG